MRIRFLVAVVPALLLLAGCSETPEPAAQKAKAPQKPPEPVTGRYAFHQMFAAARAWSPDIEPLRLESLRIEAVKNQGGKAGAWAAIFVSTARRQAKTYTYSVAEGGGNLHKGVFSGPDESYSGPSGAAKPFLVQALKVDSDAAFETAMSKSADYVKKFPNQPIIFQLELTNRFPDPAWRVIWGESVSTSNYSIFVDATTGDFLQKMR